MKHILPLSISVCLIIALAITITTVNAAPPIQPPPAAPGRDAPIWEKGPQQGTITPPPIQTLRPGVLQIGGIIVNKPEGYVTVPGKINMTEGLVEYLACGPFGKLHESIVMLDAEPFALQVALLLMGLEPGNKPITHQGAPETPVGAPVTLWISWEDAQKQTVKYKAEDLILNKQTDKTMPPTTWVFTGSQILDGQFMAQVEQSIVAIFHDPFALLDHTGSTGSDDTNYFANSHVLPPRGTSITFTIKPSEKIK